ncbi:hypothetical protein [Flavobacterium undicola]|uniref:hypothetical protein n=1 Tax=Flavobacterium undicola TaxID=1932779 RepID=UPI00137766D7|nr:hypothetical protein [Flavobacterium undicola]MBA0882456.1 hypothetical protein [Flavobacterium undicola]
MNSVICDFFKENNFEQIVILFSKNIKNPQSGVGYPLIYNTEFPQFYFVDVLSKEVQARPGYELVGYFTTDDINDASLFQKKIAELKEK